MMTRRQIILSSFAGLITIILGIISPAHAETKIKHVSGETVLMQTPKKVVVFDLASLDNMNRLGIDSVIGIPETPMPKYLAKYADNKDLKKVGTLFEPNYETLSTLAPDLIIVSGRSQPKFEELSKIAPTIDLTVSNDAYLADVKRNVTILGDIFGKQEQAKTELLQLDKTLADVKTKATDKGNGLLILTTGGKISAFGPGSRFGLLYSGFGITPVAKDLSTSKHGQMISPEFIFETNPEWLFVIDRDAAIGREGEAAEQLLNNDVIKRTKASQDNHIVYLDPQNWYLIGGGLSGLHETAQQLENAFSK